ncbi:CAF17-like 4Fe-4S cluster assembly/insertion protein YgfZ [Candidatus Foliamicus sp.]
MNASAMSGNASGPAALRLESLAAIQVDGEDRHEFLQGQLSQDMHKITAQHAAPAAWCNRQGRVLCFAAVAEWQDAIYLVVPADISETCAQGLRRFVLRARVRIEPSGLPVYGCVNAGAAFPATAEKPADAAWACTTGPGYCALRLPGEAQRALLIGDPPQSWDEAAKSGWSAERWRLADIKAEIPWIGEAASGKFLAHSLNLDRSGAVSFAKGCYVGQEIIARMEHRGTPKRRMQPVRLPQNAAAEPGARIAHPELGAITIISAAQDGEAMQALAEVRLASER